VNAVKQRLELGPSHALNHGAEQWRSVAITPASAGSSSRLIDGGSSSQLNGWLGAAI
jgi:hypothetical protein